MTHGMPYRLNMPYRLINKKTKKVVIRANCPEALMPEAIDPALEAQVWIPDAPYSRTGSWKPFNDHLG